MDTYMCPGQIEKPKSMGEETRYLVRWPPKYQCHLGRSDSNQLMLIKPDRKWPRYPPRHKALMALPDELVLPILEFAAEIELMDDYELLQNDEELPTKMTMFAPQASYLIYRDAVSISFTCRRFHRLITPYMYRRHHVGFWIDSEWTRGYLPRKGTRHLHRTLRENPPLRQYCRELRFYMYFPASACIVQKSPNDPGPVYLDMVSWLTQTKVLKFDLRHNTMVHFFLRLLGAAIRHMPRLEQLFLPDCNVTNLKMVAWILTRTPTLKSMQVRFITGENDRRLGPLFTRPLPDLPGEGFSNITTLSLGGCDTTPGDLLRAVMMPRALRKFSILSLPMAGHKRWTLADISTLIGPHKQTLETLIVTANLYREHSRAFPDSVYEDVLPILPNLQQFPKLHSLTLSVVSAGHVDQQAWILSAPNLRWFAWYQGANLRALPRLFLDDFDDGAERWVLTLATTATARNSSLKEIFIRFSKDHYTYRDPEEVTFYVEDRLERLAAAVAAQNVKMTWNTTWNDPQYCKGNTEPVRHLMMRGTLIERMGIKHKLRARRARKGPSFHGAEWHGQDPLWLPDDEAGK